ncbi:hypothetical protein MRX96_040996 [Rhipicephalus microplus]
MKLSIATAVAALCALLALGSAALLGAPMKHDAKDFENYLDEAHYVAATQVDGREFYDTVVEILEAENADANAHEACSRAVPNPEDFLPKKPK